MKKNDLLTPDEVIKKGLEFDGEVCFSGEYGQQVYTKPMEDGGVAVNGLLYEKYPNGHLAYYGYYENGIEHGDSVFYYKDGSIMSYCTMEKGTIYGEKIELYENGTKKLVKNCRYGINISYTMWDENGNVIDKKEEPDEGEKKLLERFKIMYEE